MKNFFKSLIRKYKKETEERKNEAAREQAKEMFQITEYLNEFWITYNGILFCPCKLFNSNDAIDTLAKIRYEYLKRVGAV